MTVWIAEHLEQRIERLRGETVQTRAALERSSGSTNHLGDFPGAVRSALDHLAEGMICDHLPVDFGVPGSFRWTSPSPVHILFAQVRGTDRARCGAAVARFLGALGGDVFIERLWRSAKYAEIYRHACHDGREARQQLAAYFDTCNRSRLHQSLDCHTPDEIYFGGRADDFAAAA